MAGSGRVLKGEELLGALVDRLSVHDSAGGQGKEVELSTLPYLLAWAPSRREFPVTKGRSREK